MRLLTIKRNKSFPGCLVKNRVYIEDINGELTICGVPCRFLGTLKNGEEKSFPIDHESRQIFMIFNPKNKESFNSSATIPAGDESIRLSGKYCVEGGAYPFRFEGIAPTAEQLAREQVQKKRSTRSTILGAVIGTIIGVAVLFLAAGITSKAEKQTFTKGDFSITLTEDFAEADYEDFYASYESNYVGITVLQESKADIGYMSLPGYAKLLIKLNGYNLTLQESDNFVWCSYTESVDGMNYYYQVYFYDSDEAFWTVNFCVPAGKQDEYESKFLKWAESVKIAQAA